MDGKVIPENCLERYETTATEERALPVPYLSTPWLYGHARTMAIFTTLFALYFQLFAFVSRK